MRTDEFHDYIQKGLGRAILLLRAEIDKTPFFDAVWKHALNDMRYDSQCSGSRGHYIKELFECFDNSEELFYELFRIYSTVGADSCYRDYYIDNLYSLAIEGVIGASDTLDTLYGVLFDKLISSPNPLTNGLDRERDDYCDASRLRFDLNKNIAESLIMDALTLLERSPRFDMRDLKDLFITLNDKNGIFNAAVEKVKNENTKAKETLDEYENYKRSKSNCLNIEKDIKPTNWREAIEIGASNGNRTVCFKKHLWENLSNEDRIEIARLLEDKTDKKRRFELLCNLNRCGQEFLRNYPCDPGPLIAELEDKADILFPVSAKTILHRWLSNVVSQIVHPAVREFAIRNLPYYNQKTNSISHSIAFTAFLNNYHPEDEEYIYELVASITDTDHLHEAGMDLLHADAPISERVLIYLYENTPCSICRCSFFNRLMVSYQKAHNTTLDSLPAHLAAIKEEAKHDCEQATRFSAHANYIEKGK